MLNNQKKPLKPLGTIAKNGNGCGNDCEKTYMIFAFSFCCDVINLQQKTTENDV